MQDDSTPSLSKPSKRGRHGNHRRGRRVDYIAVACEICGAVREYSPGQMKQRGTIRFCSRACCAEGQRRATTMADVTCSRCGVSFQKRRDHLHERNYCSRACAVADRRVDGAKWRDPEQIREYMREYNARHREKHNKRLGEWAKANRGKRNANQRLRRAAGHGRGSKGRARRELIAFYGERCMRCGATDRVEVDHVVPVALGGANDISNLQLLCRTCNASKGANTVDYRLMKAVYGIDVKEVAA